jgi:glycosyltransferase involved in cell wall biosynthesis
MLKFLFIARETPHKGLPDLLRAFELLDRDDWYLKVIGGHNLVEAEEIHRLVVQLTRIEMGPPVPNALVPSFMRSADVVVVPSRYENFCIVALEAMASGRAVIGSRCGGIPDLIRHCWNGLLFPPGDAQALAHNLTTLLNNPSQAFAFGEQGRRAAQRFDWSVVVRETIELLQSFP